MQKSNTCSPHFIELYFETVTMGCWFQPNQRQKRMREDMAGVGELSLCMSHLGSLMGDWITSSGTCSIMPALVVSPRDAWEGLPFCGCPCMKAAAPTASPGLIDPCWWKLAVPGVDPRPLRCSDSTSLLVPGWAAERRRAAADVSLKTPMCPKLPCPSSSMPCWITPASTFAAMFCSPGIICS